MEQEILSNDIIPRVDAAFPDFPLSLGDTGCAVEENPTVYLTLLCSFLSEHWQDNSIHVRLKALLENFASAANPSTKIVIHDFLLDFYLHFHELNLPLSEFLDSLKADLKDRILHAFEFWMTANKQAANN